VVPAICYEALIPEHAAHAGELGATVYVATLAKPKRGATYAHTYFPEAARRHQFDVIMCNASEGRTTSSALEALLHGTDAVKCSPLQVWVRSAFC